MEVVAPWPTPGVPQKYWEINGKTEVFIAGPPKYGRPKYGIDITQMLHIYPCMVYLPTKLGDFQSKCW